MKITRRAFFTGLAATAVTVSFVGLVKPEPPKYRCTEYLIDTDNWYLVDPPPYRCHYVALRAGTGRASQTTTRLIFDLSLYRVRSWQAH
ncbi:MAG: hypothetical protein H8E94_09475 [Alphaproteobacteria bacterium]|nr:hypothetical protein [Alphaproteobacteria bacterium]